jgi:L-lactate dehydrogenase complex protein LldG
MVAAAMTDARTAILGRVAQAIEGAAAPTTPRAYRRTGALTAAERVDLFCDRVGDYRAEVVRVDLARVEAAVAGICSERGFSILAVPPQLPWRPQEVELVEDHGLSPADLDRVDGALTGCTTAVAETGTIVLSGGEHEGRRALTLVPDLHICVVRESQICELLPEALERIDPRRPITFISGPSATSDIELSRVEGVHGPRTLIVLVAKESL